MDEMGSVSSSEQEALLNRLMRRQASLSIRVAIGFIAMLIALPLVNLYAPKLAATDVFGFTLTWLVLGVLFYPLTWLLSGYFVKQSDRIEESLLREESITGSADTPVGAASESPQPPNTQHPTPNTADEGGKE